MIKNVILLLSTCLLFVVISCTKKPAACFTFSRTIVKVGDTLSLLNCSTNFTDVNWALPFGATTSVVGPRVKVQNAGEYTVTLTVGLDNFNAQNSITHSITVLP